MITATSAATAIAESHSHSIHPVMLLAFIMTGVMIVTALVMIVAMNELERRGRSTMPLAIGVGAFLAVAFIIAAVIMIFFVPDSAYA